MAASISDSAYYRITLVICFSRYCMP